MNKMRKKEFFLGIAMILIAISYYIGALGIQTRDNVITSRTIPIIISSVMLLVGVIQVFTNLKEAAKEKNLNFSESKSIDVITVLKVGIVILLYVILFQSIGFLISTAIFLFLMFYFLTPNYQKPNIYIYMLLSVGVSLGVYLFFRYGLNIMLPQGIIRGI